MQKEGEEEKRRLGKGEGGGKNLRESIWIGIRCILGLPVPSTTFTSADGYKY